VETYAVTYNQHKVWDKLHINRSGVPSSLPEPAILIKQIDLASNAICHIGPKATPYLLYWIDYEQPAWNAQLCKYFRNHWGTFGKSIALRLSRTQRLSNFSYMTLGFHGPAAEEAIPGLAKLLNSPKPSLVKSAVELLGEMGPKGLPPLMAAFDDTSRTNRLHLACVLSPWSTNSVPFLLKALKDKDPVIRKYATNRLNAISPSTLQHAKP
jgi:hypothetical protein